MSNDNYEHIKQEQTNWLKTLEALRQENLSLKNRLTEIIKKNVSGDTLERIEFFQGLFLDKDTVISLLRRDIAHLSAQTNEETVNKVSKEHTKLKNDIARMQQEMEAVKTSFNQFSGFVTET